MARAKSLCDKFPTVGASLEDICQLTVLIKLRIFGKIDQGMEVPHTISALTKLKILQLALVNIKTLPAEMAYSLKQLQDLHLYDLKNLEYLPRSFTSSDAFPALISLNIDMCSSLVEFPEAEEGALPNLRTLVFNMCYSLASLPLSLEVLTSLRELTLYYCGVTIKNSCRINCEKSSIWRSFNIDCGFGSWQKTDDLHNL
jgi:hypothetical protein